MTTHEQRALAASQYIASLYDEQQAGYRYFETGPTTLLSTAFAVQTLYILRDQATVPENVVARLVERQAADGAFQDPLFRTSDTRGSHSPSYIRWQFSFFALTALDMLGQRPRHSLDFMEPFLDRNHLSQWMAEREWRRFWYCSNEIMFLLYFLTYLSEREGISEAKRAALLCLDILDEHQDSETGYWGAGKENPYDSMYGAAHIYMFYDFYSRPIHHADRIIDYTLRLQHPSGLYGSEYGGACEDYDGLDVLLKVARHSSNREQDVEQAAKRMLSTIQARQSANGGYSYRLLPKRGRFVHGLRFLSRRPRTYSYSGWNTMTASVFKPDTWGTYFRVLAIAAASARAGSKRYQFYALPSWGYAGGDRPVV